MFIALNSRNSGTLTHSASSWTDSASRITSPVWEPHALLSVADVDVETMVSRGAGSDQATRARKLLIVCLQIASILGDKVFPNEAFEHRLDSI